MALQLGAVREALVDLEPRRKRAPPRSGLTPKENDVLRMKAIARSLIAAALLLAPAARAQPADFVRQFQELPNAGALYLKFCVGGSTLLCEERRAIAYGQVCDPGLAHDMGTGQSGDVVGGLPGWPRHYAGWRCDTAASAADLPHGTSGGAEPPSLPGEPVSSGDEGRACQNWHEKQCDLWVSDSGVPLGFCPLHGVDGSCQSWSLSPAGAAEMKRRVGTLPDCPAGMSFGQILAAHLACHIPASQIEVKPVGGFAN